jgi:hypothetical protein
MLGWGMRRGRYGSGGGADEHVLICIVSDGINERLNLIQGFVSFERSCAEIIEFMDGNKRRLFVIRAFLSWGHNNLFIGLSLELGALTQ